MLRLQILIPSVSLNSYFKLSGREMTKQTISFLIPAVTEKLTIRMSVAELCPLPPFFPSPVPRLLTLFTLLGVVGVQIPTVITSDQNHCRFIC